MRSNSLSRQSGDRLRRGWGVFVGVALLAGACGRGGATAQRTGSAGGVQNAMSTAFLVVEFPASSADVNSTSTQAWLAFEGTVRAKVFNPCMEASGFNQPWELVPTTTPPPQDNEHFPDVQRLQAGQWWAQGTPSKGDLPAPGSVSASEDAAVKAAQRACSAEDPFAPLQAKLAPVALLYGQMLNQVYADPRVTGAWNNSFVPCMQQAGINVDSLYGWKVYLDKYQQTHGTIDSSVARIYGKCVASVATVMDQLRLKGRQTLFDQHALQVQQIVATAGNLIRELSDQYGLPSP